MPTEKLKTLLSMILSRKSLSLCNLPVEIGTNPSHTYFKTGSSEFNASQHGQYKHIAYHYRVQKYTYSEHISHLEDHEASWDIAEKLANPGDDHREAITILLSTTMSKNRFSLCNLLVVKTGTG